MSAAGAPRGEEPRRAASPPEGLCASCRHRQLVRNTRGSVFSLCRRSRTDASFPRYPRLPVSSCCGYERLDPGARER